jgi:hypothetical protein
LVLKSGCRPFDCLAGDWWKALGCWAVDCSNPNSLASACASVLTRTSADIILLQETKHVTSSGDPYATQRACRNTGWSTAPTSAKQAAGHSAAGGMLVGARRSAGLVPMNQHADGEFEHRLAFLLGQVALSRGAYASLHLAEGL